MRRLIGACLAAVLLLPSVGAVAQTSATYAVPYDETLETVVFPLPAMMRAADGWAAALRRDPVLRRLTADRAARVPDKPCVPTPACQADAWLWTAAEIATVETRLRQLARDPQLADALMTRVLRPSDQFARYNNLSDGDLIAAAWAGTAAAMNHVVDVYAKGIPPRYPLIDAIIFDPLLPEYGEVLIAHAAAVGARDGDLFFDPALRYATGLLRMNERTDAASHRPLLGGENTAAIQAVAHTNWSATPYTALLVFGHGPEDAVSRTGVMGHIRLEIAADHYKRGLAPFLIVSGGNVHPNRTAFNEAIEMKRLLISDYGIPADRILIEPHARHTTTNLRNCARLLLAAGFPADRPALVVSDPRTITYIGGAELAKRNVAEMGVQPGTLTPGPDRFSLRFAPDPVAFQVDAAADPLDP
ncbi:YdcF family protein [Sphingomonas arantia]|uniref:YdcF family protein n=1 Tax=Sphingomonas arantia TaxID=1460676 RepID=A0ABW4TZQ0_9SPHN